MAIVCHNCGRQNPDGTEFCQNCGIYLEWDRDQNAGTPGPVRGGATARPAPEGQRVAAAITIADAELTVQPGDAVTTTVTVMNGGSQVEEFVLMAMGPGAAYATVNPDRLQVYPGQNATATVVTAPPRRSDVPPSRTWLTIRAASTLHRGLTADANAQLTIGEFRELTAALMPERSRGRLKTRHTVEVTNAGNVVEAVRVTGSDPTGTVRFDLSGIEQMIAPGKAATTFKVQPPLKLLGQPQDFPFNVIVTPREPAQPINLNGFRELVPFIPRWVPKVAAGAAALAVAAAIGLWMINRDQGTTPTDPAATALPGQSAPVEGGGKESSMPSEEPEETPPPEETEEPVDTFQEPELNPEDCYQYDPWSLSIVDVGEPGLQVVDGFGAVLGEFDTQSDAETGLAVAQVHNQACYIGRENLRPVPNDYIVEYWLGTGLDGTEPDTQCFSYDPDNLSYYEDDQGWHLLSGDQQLLLLDTETDAENAYRLAQAYTRQCFIGLSNARPEFTRYLTYYWLFE